jgi:hypothetical protein
LIFFFLGSTWYYRGPLPLGDGSQGEGKIAAMDSASKKWGFRSIYSVGGFTEAIGSKLLDPRALGNQ